MDIRDMITSFREMLFLDVRSLFYFLGSVCSTNWGSSLFYRGCSLFYRQVGVCSTKKSIGSSLFYQKYAGSSLFYCESQDVEQT